VLHPAKANEEGYIVYRIDAPNDIVRLTYGGRFYNRAPKSHCDLLHSFDGSTWTPSWSLSDNQAALGCDPLRRRSTCRAVTSRSGSSTRSRPRAERRGGGSGLYAARIEANFVPLDPVSSRSR
jgi:hypothetical protein